jgi:hypothetical protein
LLAEFESSPEVAPLPKPNNPPPVVEEQYSPEVDPPTEPTNPPPVVEDELPARTIGTEPMHEFVQPAVPGPTTMLARLNSVRNMQSLDALKKRMINLKTTQCPLCLKSFGVKRSKDRHIAENRCNNLKELIAKLSKQGDCSTPAGAGDLSTPSSQSHVSASSTPTPRSVPSGFSSVRASTPRTPTSPRDMSARESEVYNSPLLLKLSTCF